MGIVAEAKYDKGNITGDLMKKFKVTVNGQAYEVEVEEIGAPAKTVSSVPAVNTQPAPAAAVKEAPKPVEVKPVPAAVTAVHGTHRNGGKRQGKSDGTS